MDILIQATADPSKGEALFHAIHQGKIRTVSNIIDGGCDVNVRNANKRTPLMQAVFVTKDDVRTHIVRMLLGKGCDVNAQDEDGRTALMLAAFEPNRDDVVRRVISTGKCDPNLKDFKGDSALIHAVYGGNASVIRILVNSAHTKGLINVNITNIDKLNPLKLAFKLRQEECCKVLIEEGGAKTSAVKDRERIGPNMLQSNEFSNTEFPVMESTPGRKPLNDPFMELLASTSGYEMHTDNDPNIEDRKTNKRPRKKRSKKSTVKDEGDGDSLLGFNLLNPVESTSRSTVTFALDPLISRSNTLTCLTDSRMDSHTPRSTYSRNIRLTPINSTFELTPRTPKPPVTPETGAQVGKRNTSATLWPAASEECDRVTPVENLFTERDKKAKARRKKKKVRARLSPLNSGHKNQAPPADDSGVTPRGSLLPAIPTNGRKINLVGTPEIYKNMDS